MNSYFDTDFFKGNRRRLRGLYGKDAPIVVTANGLMQRNSDSTFKYRQDSSFWYLTGIEQSDVLLVMDADDEYLIVPERDEVRTAFDGAVAVESLLAVSGANTVLEEAEGWKRLGKRLKSARRVGTLDSLPEYVEHMGMYSNPARARLVRQLTETVGEKGIDDIREHVMQLRIIKQPCELEALRKAVDITIDGIEYAAARQRLQKYRFEFEAEAELTRRFKLDGASSHAFEPIIVSGKRACTMHNLAMDGRLSQDELVQFDVGAEFQMYAGDLSRVFAVGEPTARQEAVHAAVCKVQDYAYGMLKPGTLLSEYEQKVADYLGEELQALGVVKRHGLSDKQYQHAVRQHFPHGTSHFLGLDVHDVGDYRKPLQPGMVITCEPGIYIADEGIGIRIEDDVLITEDGHEVLSHRLSRQLVP